jgi:hypothetical protein
LFTDVDRINNSNYVLVTPMLSDSDTTNAKSVYLLNKNSDIVHEWHTSFPPFSSTLSQDGQLYVLGFDNGKLESRADYEHQPNFQVLDKESKTIWEYHNKCLHHDFAKVSNDSFVFICSDPTPMKNYLRPEMNSANFKNEMIIFDKLIEVDRKTGQIIWEWSVKDHVPLDDMKPFHAAGDFTHFNSVKYTESNPINHTPAFLISARHTSSVYIVEKSSGNILWTSPKDMFLYQHDARFLEGGLISVFNNGKFISKVMIVDPVNNEVKWQFDGGDGFFDKVSFFSTVVSGAQMMDNKNFLITLGVQGFLVEVTPSKEVVWRSFVDFLSPVKGKAWPYRMIFKSESVTHETFKHLL